MTGKLAGQLMETGFLTGVSARVAIALASVSDSHGQSWYSYSGIAHYARCSRKSVIGAVRWMELTELLHVQRGANLATKSGKKTSTTNLYTLNLEFFEALHTMAEMVRRATPGDAREKWRAVKAAANWAEDQVRLFQWRMVVEIVQHHPHVIRQTCVDAKPPHPAPDRTDNGNRHA